MQHQQPQAAQSDQNIQTFPTSGSTATTSQIDGELQTSSDAVVRPESASPLVSSDPSMVMAPVNAEGPYSELKDESVSSRHLKSSIPFYCIS